MKVLSPTPEKLLEALHSGQVKFQYKKKSGERRTATGTLKENMISMPRRGGENIVANSGYQVYFDLDKQDWRCYNPSMVISMEV